MGKRRWTFKVLELLKTMGTFKVALNTFSIITQSGNYGDKGWKSIA